MGIRDFLNRLREKREKYKQFEQEMNVQEKYYERKKSANERELERFHEEDRQRRIKAELEAWRTRTAKEAKTQNQILRTKNMFRGDGSSLLKERKLFTNKHSIMHKEALFFK